MHKQTLLALTLVPVLSASAASATGAFEAPSIVAVSPADRVLVLDVKVVDVPAALGPVATGAVVEALAGGGLEALGQSSIVELAQLEADKATTGCADESCLAELGAAAEAKLFVTGSIGRVGKDLLVSLSLVRTDPVVVENRVSGATTEANLVADVKSLAATLVGLKVAEAPKFSLGDGELLKLAVFDLRAAGTDATLARNLTQVLGAELKRVEGISVIGREDVAALLELEADKATLGCSEDESCLAELGAALGVDKLVTGQVGKLSNTWVVSLRLLDTKNVKVDGVVSESFSGREESVIGAVRHAGRRLLGVGGDARGPILVNASEPGAEVFVDGVMIGETPLAPVEVPAGRRAVRVSRDGFLDWRGDVYVHPGETSGEWAELERRPALIEPFLPPWGLYTLAGLAGAAVVGAAVAGGIQGLTVLEARDFAEQNAATPGKSDGTVAVELEERARVLGVTTYALLGVGAGLAVLTAAALPIVDWEE